MKFALINVSCEQNGFVSGSWIQDFTGTLEQAAEYARETEMANSNRITVAVVEDKCYTPFTIIRGGKRLDITESLSEKNRSCRAENRQDCIW